MGVKVAKFGGSSVADALQIGKIKNIIENDPDIHYVVVSAPGKRFSDDSKVTDLLYLCKAHIEHNLPYEQLFQVVCGNPVSVTEGISLGIYGGFKNILRHDTRLGQQGHTLDDVPQFSDVARPVIGFETLYGFGVQ